MYAETLLSITYFINSRTNSRGDHDRCIRQRRTGSLRRQGGKISERSAARVVEIKSALMNWLAPSDTIADSVCITNALLELALDRHVEVHEANGFDLIDWPTAAL